MKFLYKINKYTLVLFILLVLMSLIACLFFFDEGNFMSAQEKTFNSQVTDSKLAPRSNTVDISSASQDELNVTDGEINLDNNQAAAVALVPGCQPVVVIASTIKSYTIQYGITLRNRGTENCQNVSYSVYYPEEERYINANPKPSASDYYWNVGTIKSGATLKKYQLTTRFTSSFGGIELCLTASNYEGDVCVTATSTKVTSLLATSNYLPQINLDSNMTSSSAGTNIPMVPSGKEYGVWVWNSPVVMSSAKMDQIIAGIKAAGFNTIYITIDDVQSYERAKYVSAMATFVSKANEKGIEVDALAGASDWAKPENRSKGFSMIDFVIAYNKNNPKLRGFQYDVEPYLLPEYEGNKEKVLTDFVVFIDESEKRLAGSGLTFSVVVPHFYDSTQAWTPKITFGNVSNYTFNHLSAILDRNIGNSIIIMSYRNYFTGKGGTAELSTPEIEQSNKTKVIVAQETGNVEPSYVTFYGTSKKSLYTSLNNIYATYSNKPGFGGTAVHYWDTFAELP